MADPDDEQYGNRAAAPDAVSARPEIAAALHELINSNSIVRGVLELLHDDWNDLDVITRTRIAAMGIRHSEAMTAALRQLAAFLPPAVENAVDSPPKAVSAGESPDHRQPGPPADNDG